MLLSFSILVIIAVGGWRAFLYFQKMAALERSEAKVTTLVSELRLSTSDFSSCKNRLFPGAVSLTVSDTATTLLKLYEIPGATLFLSPVTSDLKQTFGDWDLTVLEFVPLAPRLAGGVSGEFLIIGNLRMRMQLRNGPRFDLSQLPMIFVVDATLKAIGCSSSTSQRSGPMVLPTCAIGTMLQMNASKTWVCQPI
jgi:hypothetical protein